jgi:hypothetical protein
MPWLKTDDQAGQNVKLRGLVDDGVTGRRAVIQGKATRGHWHDILTWCAAARTDGFATAAVVDEPGTEDLVRRLLRARYDRAPLIHKRGPDGSTPACKCLVGRTWPADYDYAVHDFLDYNPSRSENDVEKAKKRELRDAALKRAVRDRDEDMCRYCGKHCKQSDRVSDDGLTFDHVDPRIANGIDNLVVACRGCNLRKGRRTPREADMPLLAAPGTPAPDLEQTCGGPATGPTTVAGPVTGPGAGLSQHLSQVSGPSQTHMSPGRDGHPPGSAPPAQGTCQPSPLTSQIGPPTTIRGPGASSPYDRESVPGPDSHAGHPGPQP